jgi:glycosyltransferase involved in cell wall biosynthesis
MQPDINKIAFIGNYLPRQCGIATFTADLCESLAGRFPHLQCFAVPVTDVPEGYRYPDRVRFELKEQELESYQRAANFLNISNSDVISLQHEYGIYGGPAGGYILSLLRSLHIPVVTTLHTVLTRPNRHQQRVMEELADLSDLLVVMTQRGRDFLTALYRVDPAKVRVVAHGIPDVSFIDPNFYKDQFGVEGKLVLLTFGLLSPNKGIEFALRALPDVVARHPQVVYIILGATHPHLVRREGEAYRIHLQRLARELGIEKHVMFLNRFVSPEELKEFLAVSDIYLTPYLSEEQITSGTLAYAFGAGNAVISTPFWHAADLLADGRGKLVPFADAPALTAAITGLIDNTAERHALRKQAYLLGRDMIWDRTAERYLEVFAEARHKRPASLRKKNTVLSLDAQPPELPKIKLDHLRRLTDSTGILQHAVFSVPNYAHGYCTDDNARALTLTVLLEELGDTAENLVTDLTTIYLAFLHHAFDPDTRRFRNFMGYNRVWLPEEPSEDCHGRALWALGTCLGRSRHISMQHLAGQLFELALSVVEGFSSPRAWSFAIVGIHEYLRRFEGDRLVYQIREKLAGRLFDLYNRHHGPDWPWFEDSVTYCNGKLPHALILCGRWLQHEEMLQAGLQSLAWLIGIQTSAKQFLRPVGSNGFYTRGGAPARFDQQPIEAHTLLAACLEAYRTTRDERWHTEAAKCFQWFLGRNDLGQPLYDPQTGGCCDALLVDRVNQNQGAESSLAFYLSLAEMLSMENMIASLREPLNT